LKLKKNIFLNFQTEEQLQKSYQAINDLLFEAKRENVHLQLEAIYRERLHAIYTAVGYGIFKVLQGKKNNFNLHYQKTKNFVQVKRQMDFLSEYEATRRRFEQKHMAEWIMQQVCGDEQKLWFFYFVL
jgi:hypothetical protein